MVFSLVVGLGNVGAEYIGTRHNLGFEVVGRVAQALKARRLPSRPSFEAAETSLTDSEGVSSRLILAVPTTYMNRSGLAVLELLEELALTPREMLVVVDDVDLPLGALRIRPSGSDGGHNGLYSIIEQLQTEDFPRLRLGIGRPPVDQDTADYVLSRFRPEEANEVERMVAFAAEAVIFAATHRLEEAMLQFNRNPALPDQE